METLKNCPFCGKLPTIGEWKGMRAAGELDATAIECSSDLYDCPCNPGHSAYTRAEAIAAWNRRTTPSDDSELVRVPRVMLEQVYGMAREGCESPNAGYRWCERIDELFHEGASISEYNDYALPLPAAMHAPAPDNKRGEGEDLRAHLSVLADFAKTAPGRLPERVQKAIDAARRRAEGGGV